VPQADSSGFFFFPTFFNVIFLFEDSPTPFKKAFLLFAAGFDSTAYPLSSPSLVSMRTRFPPDLQPIPLSRIFPQFRGREAFYFFEMIPLFPVLAFSPLHDDLPPFPVKRFLLFLSSFLVIMAPHFTPLFPVTPPFHFDPFSLPFWGRMMPLLFPTGVLYFSPFQRLYGKF